MQLEEPLTFNLNVGGKAFPDIPREVIAEIPLLAARFLGTGAAMLANELRDRDGNYIVKSVAKGHFAIVLQYAEQLAEAKQFDLPIPPHPQVIGTGAPQYIHTLTYLGFEPEDSVFLEAKGDAFELDEWSIDKGLLRDHQRTVGVISSSMPVYAVDCRGEGTHIPCKNLVAGDAAACFQDNSHFR
eukprot:GDKI01003225.1.p1 GENE.GDKI01003225.1~~GDKI01003225.1.p1  ORF type:complete len:185 (-),score=43.73 GDKI01003225.1:674-1228(-)